MAWLQRCKGQGMGNSTGQCVAGPIWRRASAGPAVENRLREHHQCLAEQSGLFVQDTGAEGGRSGLAMVLACLLRQRTTGGNRPLSVWGEAGRRSFAVRDTRSD